LAPRATHQPLGLRPHLDVGQHHVPSQLLGAPQDSECAGADTPDDIQRAIEQAGALGVFIRALVGLDRMAAKGLFAEFLDDGTYSADQIEFVNMVINELTANGIVPARRFYESLFVDITPKGPEGLFPAVVFDRLFEIVDRAAKVVQSS